MTAAFSCPVDTFFGERVMAAATPDLNHSSKGGEGRGGGGERESERERGREKSVCVLMSEYLDRAVPESLFPKTVYQQFPIFA